MPHLRRPTVCPADLCGGRWRRLVRASGAAARAVAVLAVVALLAAFPTAAAASDEHPLLDEWRWAEFGPDSGLPAVRVTQVAETASGDVWAATAVGLYRYDGYVWTRADPGPAPADPLASHVSALPAGDVLAVAGDRLWVGGRAGLREIVAAPAESWSRVIEAVPLDGGRVVAAVWGRGRTSPRLVETDLRGTSAGDAPSAPALGRSPHLWRTPSGVVWVAAASGMWSRRGAEWKPRLVGPEDLCLATDVAEAPDGTTYVAVTMPVSRRGLWRFAEGGDGTLIDAHAPAALAVDAKGDLVAAYSSGDVRVCRKGAWSFLPHVPDPIRNVVFLAYRRNGDLWAGTETGLSLCHGYAQRWSRRRRGLGDRWDSVNAIVEAHDGSIWLATEAGVEVRRPHGGSTTFESAGGASLGGATGIAEDGDGNVWVSSGGTFEGVQRFDGSAWRRFGPGDGLHAGYVHAVTRDRRGRLWFLGLTKDGPDPADEGPGAFVLDRGTFTRWSVQEGLPDGHVYAFAQAPDGALWFGTRRGAARFRAGAWTTWGAAEGVPRDKVFAIAIDGAGRAWLALQDNGLVVVETDDTVRRIGPGDGLPSNSVWDVRTGDDGSVWASTWGGIWHGDGDTWSVFGGREGMEMVHAWPILPLRNRVYVGTVGAGTCILDLAERGGPVPRVTIAAPVVEDGRALVRWTTASYWATIAPGDVRTRWRVDGGPWSAFTTDREVTLVGLPAGPHRLEVASKGPFGETRPVSAGVSFEVPAPPWQRLHFVLPVSTLLAAVVVMADLLRRRRARHLAEMRDAAERVREAQRLESVGRLAGGVAHDFNNLVTIIISFASALRPRVRRDAQATAEVGEILTAAGRAAALTRDLLAFGRRQPTAPTLLDLNSVARSTLQMVRTMVGSGVEVVLDLAADVGRVRADPNQVSQVILNLASNARDAMEGRGRLTIATRNVARDAAGAPRGGALRGRSPPAEGEDVPRGPARWPEDPRAARSFGEVATQGAPADGWVVLSVADTGCGIDEATQARVFEPFFTTKGVGRGTGLGLSSVYGIAAQNGGDATVESAPGAGATFRLWLPRVEAPAAPPPGTGDALAPAVGRRTVLVVDPDDAVRGVAREALSAEGHEVLVAADAREAAGIWSRHPYDIDLLVTDLAPPNADGRDTAWLFLDVYPDARVAFLSGDPGAAADALDDAPAGSVVLRKPFAPEEFRERVRDLLAEPARTVA